MQENNITVKNSVVNYKIFGQGKPLLILHGWSSSSEKWHRVAELLAEKNIMSVIPDLPGFGLSPEPSESWSLDTYVEWVYEFSDNLPELKESFYLLGHSFGGALAAKFAIKYNQRLKKLFLVSAACVRQRTFFKRSIYRISKVVKLFKFLPYYVQFRKAFYRFILRKSDYPNVSGIMKETYLRVVSDDLSYRINFIKVPTAVIWGDKDEFTPFDEGKFIHDQIPGSSFDVITGGVHALEISFPELLVEKILSTL